MTRKQQITNTIIMICMVMIVITYGHAFNRSYETHPSSDIAQK